MRPASFCSASRALSTMIKANAAKMKRVVSLIDSDAPKNIAVMISKPFSCVRHRAALTINRERDINAQFNVNISIRCYMKCARHSAMINTAIRLERRLISNSRAHPKIAARSSGKNSQFTVRQRSRQFADQSVRREASPTHCASRRREPGSSRCCPRQTNCCASNECLWQRKVIKQRAFAVGGASAPIRARNTGTAIKTNNSRSNPDAFSGIRLSDRISRKRPRL